MTTANRSTQSSSPDNLDSKALWGGIIFSFVFTLLIWVAGQGGMLERFTLIIDKPEITYWYPWRLATPTFWTHATAWAGYTLHQVAIWWFIYQAQQERPKYVKGLHKFNKLALGTNALFITLHFLQTLVFYDGLAGSTPEWLAQWSVIIMLVAILLMENQRRGLFFGKKAPGLKEAGRVTRKYHGYFFAWAIIWTFWYHPLEFTGGHLVGFFYMFLLMLQGSLFFTRMHVNRYWMAVQEVMVLFHGTLVAIIDPDQEIWPMFFFGFFGIFIVTQMYGLRLKQWQRLVFFAMYIGGALLVYSQRGWNMANELVRIPVAEWLLVFVLAAIVWLLAKGVEKVTGNPV